MIPYRLHYFTSTSTNLTYPPLAPDKSTKPYINLQTHKMPQTKRSSRIRQPTSQEKSTGRPVNGPVLLRERDMNPEWEAPL
jgi:hypothetical protein